MHAYSIYRLSDGVVLRSGTTSDGATVMVAAEDDEGLWYGEELRPLVDSVVDGEAVIGTAPAIPVTAADVKAHAARLLRGTDWIIVRASEDASKPVPEDVSSRRAAIRAASNRVEIMNPIPADFRGPKYWT